MPQGAASVHSTVPSAVAGINKHHAAMSLTQQSSITAASKADDNASDNGSVGSSVSLISIPSSEDADWEDSRSEVVITPPQSSRDATDYIVLYDTSSDEE